MVLHNQPTLSIGTERLACLNSPHGVQLGTLAYKRQVPGSSPGYGGRAARAFFLHPPFLPPLGDSFFFRTFPTNPAKVLGLLYTTGLVYNNPNTIKSYKNYLQNTQHMVLRNRPTL